MANGLDSVFAFAFGSLKTVLFEVTSICLLY